MSLNDPQWGKRGRSGPPDLDEIWRNVNRRVNELFGRREPDEGDLGKPPRPHDHRQFVHLRQQLADFRRDTSLVSFRVIDDRHHLFIGEALAGQVSELTVTSPG